MCGIICAVDFSKEGSNVSKWIREQLQWQLSRGTKGFGLLQFDRDLPIDLERSVEITNVLVPLHGRLQEQGAKALLLHHRQPTSSANRPDQTHPIAVIDDDFRYDYYLAHNGIITNSKEVKECHEKMDIKYVTEHEETVSHAKAFNDSECVAWEVALYLEKVDPSARKNERTLRCAGSNAFVAVKVDRDTRQAVSLIWGRNDSNPLHVHKGGANTLYLSSAGIGEDCVPGWLHEMNLKTMKTEKWKVIMPKYSDEAPEEVRPFRKATVRTGVTRAPYDSHDDRLYSGPYTVKRITPEDEKKKETKKIVTIETNRRSNPAPTKDNRDVWDSLKEEFSYAHDQASCVIASLVDEMLDAATYGDLFDYEDEKKKAFDDIEQILNKLRKDYLRTGTSQTRLLADRGGEA